MVPKLMKHKKRLTEEKKRNKRKIISGEIQYSVHILNTLQLPDFLIKNTAQVPVYLNKKIHRLRSSLLANMIQNQNNI